MLYTKLQTSAGEFKCPSFSFGTHKFGLEGNTDYDKNVSLLEQYITAGGNMIDTSRSYADGEGEKYIGKWLSANPSVRKDLIITTKGASRSVSGLEISLKEKDVDDDLAKSLDALKIDYIDLYLLHRDDTSVPVGEIIEYLNKYKKQGLIKVFGASNWSVKRINEANQYAKEHGLQGFEFSQIAFSPYVGTTDSWGKQRRVLEMNSEEYQGYLENKVPVLSFNCQAYGFFYMNFEKTVWEGVSEKNLAKLECLRKICKEQGVNPYQVIFGFYHGLDINAIPVATTSSNERLKSMLDACNFKLDKESAKKLLL